MTKTERTQLRADIRTSERMRDEIHSGFKGGTALEAVAARKTLEILTLDIAIRLRRVRQI